MAIPEYWLPRPKFDLEPHRSRFEVALTDALKTGVGHAPNAPVWAWLSWLCDEQGFVAHGTGQPDITVFEPRQSNDAGWFGNRKAVYAASDAEWAMFFAIMNRPTVPMRIVNSAIGVWVDGLLEQRYFFGASGAALTHAEAFRDGWVYLLPDVGFEREPADMSLGFAFESHHLACLESVRPVFRVRVSTIDFPFLDRIHAYDEDELAACIADPDGFPWLKVASAEMPGEHPEGHTGRQTFGRLRPSANSRLD
jgi:hypothetical protein